MAVENLVRKAGELGQACTFHGTETERMVLLCSRIARDAGLLVYIINPKKSAPAAAVGVTPKNVYCGAVDWRMAVKFSGSAVGCIFFQMHRSWVLSGRFELERSGTKLMNTVN